MENLWENWISSLEMGGDKSPSLDEDKFQLKNMQQSCFSFEGDNSISQSSTIQYINNNIFDNVCVIPTIQENILKSSNSSNSLISQEYNCPTNSQQIAPSQYILSFENSIMKPSPNSATFSSIMVPKTTLNNNIVSELPKTIKKRTKNLRSSSEIQDHIMAERKRRQVLSERFIALSATIPGLKKQGGANYKFMFEWFL
ncbi:transcription factor bHLH18 [Medicago truncatula]|uniref:transcription factor bHLH18 n=1 Tax=Medicago truncatula TaxID=3880 RepID=UPI0019689F92|nr:transcription factor bHLH18-like [Medicago truncatula]